MDRNTLYLKRPTAYTRDRPLTPTEPIKLSTSPHKLKWLFAIGVFAGGLLLSEGVCRLAGFGRLPEINEDIADWERDGYSDFFVYRPGGHINAEGLRDYPHRVANPSDAFRIACLGDSVTYGYGVHPQFSYPFQLQHWLNQGGKTAEVFNVALPGWTLRQQRLAWDRIVKKYRPDVVTLGICLNDFAEMQNNLAEPHPLLAGLFKRSYLVRALVNPAANEIAQVEEFIAQPDAPRIQNAYRIYFEELRELKTTLDAADTPLVVFAFPFRFQVEDGNRDFTPQEKVQAFCEQENILYLDLLPFFTTRGPSAFLDHDHLTAEASTALAKWLAESDKISQP